MPPKRGIDDSILIARIDERVKVLPQMKQDIRDIKTEIGEHCTRLALIEDKDRNRVHIPKGSGGGKFLATIIGFFKWL